MGSRLFELRRQATSTSWGFTMNGGVEMGQPIYIQKVVAGSIAFKAGLKPGDGILQIGQLPTEGMTHEQAKMEIIRSGNDLDFIIQRNVVPVGPSPIKATVLSCGARAEGVDYPIKSPVPAQDPSVQSRTFKVLQRQLDASIR